MLPRDMYLAYQSEIGSDEVILPKPLRPRSKIQSPSPLPLAGSPHRGISPPFKAPASPSIGKVIPVEPKAVAEPVPEFKSLDAHWKYLEENYPRWFPSAVGLARGEGGVRPCLAVVELSPAPSRQPRVFDGEAGNLLDRMMKAIHFDRGGLYLTSVMKSPPPGPYWPRKDIARMLPFLFRELDLAQPPMVLLLGEACAQAVLRLGASLASLRSRPTEAQGLIFTASHHPADLESPDAEKSTALKRQAWEDLKWVKQRLTLEGSA